MDRGGREGLAPRTGRYLKIGSRQRGARALCQVFEQKLGWRSGLATASKDVCVGAEAVQKHGNGSRKDSQRFQVELRAPRIYEHKTAASMLELFRRTADALPLTLGA